MFWKVTDSILDLVGETAGSHGMRVKMVKMQNMEEVQIISIILSIIMIICIITLVITTMVIWDIMTSVSETRFKLIDTQVFSYMDTNKDGVVTEEEFMAYCTSNNNYTNNLLVLP